MRKQHSPTLDGLAAAIAQQFPQLTEDEAKGMARRFLQEAAKHVGNSNEPAWVSVGPKGLPGLSGLSAPAIFEAVIRSITD